MAVLNLCPACHTRILIASSRFCIKCGQNLLALYLHDGDDSRPEQNQDISSFPKKWVISYFVDVSKLDDFSDSKQYPYICDKLEDYLESKVKATLREAERVESDRDGEVLSVRFSFLAGDPSDLELVPDVLPFEITEVSPFDDVYQSDNK